MGPIKRLESDDRKEVWGELEASSTSGVVCRSSGRPPTGLKAASVMWVHHFWLHKGWCLRYHQPLLSHESYVTNSFPLLFFFWDLEINLQQVNLGASGWHWEGKYEACRFSNGSKYENTIGSPFRWMTILLPLYKADQMMVRVQGAPVFISFMLV